MMSIIGHRSRFAAEYELGDKPHGSWMFGRFSFWCGGRRVGDHSLVTSLRDVLFGVEVILRYAGRRQNSRFSGMAAAEVFQQLSKGLFDVADSSAIGDVANDEEWARHIALPSVDVFDEWNAFVVEDTEAARIVTARVSEGDVLETFLRPGEFDGVLMAVQQRLNEIYVASSKETDPT